MLIILEGVDGGGKSTLAQLLYERLRNDLGCRVLTRGQPKATPLEEYILDLDTYEPGSGEHVVCDRWHVGEMVYGPLYRSASRVGPVEDLYIEMFLRAKGALVVLCHEDTDTITARLRSRGEDFLQHEHVEHVQEWYLEWLHRTSVIAIAVSAGEASVDLILKWAIRADLEATRTIAPFSTYVGPPAPSVLLLGERRGNGQGAEEKHRTAFVPYAGTSGRYLLESLLAGCPRVVHRIGLANALEEDQGVSQLSRRVVTLGRAAHRRLQEWYIPHGEVPHPQFVRRFHHGAKQEYGELIMREAADYAGRSSWRP